MNCRRTLIRLIDGSFTTTYLTPLSAEDLMT